MKKNRREFITVLNVLASLCVVALHCNGCFWEGPAQGRSWYTANLIETLCYWAVPIFFMIPGVTLIDYRSRMSTSEFFRKRVHKAFIPFIVWSCFGLLWKQLVPWNTPAADLTLSGVLDDIINARIISIYWFFPPLFALYLSLPVLSLIEQRKEAFELIALCGIVLVGAVPLTFNLLGMQWNKGGVPPIANGYLFYIALGWLLDEVELSKRNRTAIYCLALAGTLVHLVGTLLLSMSEGSIDKTFKGYSNLPAILQACGMFLLARNYDWTKGVPRTIAQYCAKIQPYTLGVYLIHWFVIDFAVNGVGINRHSILWRSAGVVAVFCICVAITWLLQQIPIARRSVPR